MEQTQFEQLKKKFQSSTVDEMIDIYISTEGLTQQQYMELLRVFPREHISKLEAALQ